MYNDPSGEIIPFFAAVLIGAGVGLASYTIGLAVTGNIHQWSIGGALKATIFGGIGGAVSFGIGNIFSVAKDGVQVATAFAEKLGTTGTTLVKAGLHGISQGILSVMQGGNFMSGFAGGFFGSLGADAWGGIMKGLGLEKFAGSTMGMVTFGALSGGIGAELSGGNFWQGAVTGGIVAGLNHAMHKMWPPDGFKGTDWADGDGVFKCDGNGRCMVYNNKDNIGGYIDLESVEIVGKSKTTKIIEKVDKSATTIGVVAELNETLVKQTKTKGIIGKYGNVLGKIGKGVGVVGAVSSIYEVSKNPTVGNILKATVSTGTVFIRMNPVIGVALGVSDIIGLSDYVYGGIDKFIYK